MDNKEKIRVGITHGDFNGIGYEVIIKSLANEGMLDLCVPVVFGSSKLMSYYKKSLGADDFKYRVVDTPSEVAASQINLVNISTEEYKIEQGQATAESGQAAAKALDMATEWLKNGDIDVLVTAPINKAAMKLAGFNYPGHTEYLEAKLGGGRRAMMMFTSDTLRLALVTIHIPISEVAQSITAEGLGEKLRQLNATMRQDFGVERPRIAVLALNPHAGDQGVIGTEDDEIVKPAIEEAFNNRIMAFGPYAADGFFGSCAWKKFDAVLAMYHDQGLAPFKTISATNGVNFTASLPYVRTSPDHGTGYDIVGKNMADAESMRHAIYEAIDIFRRRREYAAITAHPLKKQIMDRGNDKVKLDLTKDDMPADEPLLL